MTLADIVAEAAAEGVTLAVSDTGALKVTGRAEAVHRWLPMVREHKPEIIRVLSSDKKPAPISPTPSEEASIRRWLVHVQDTDPDLSAHVIERCRINQDSREYFLRRSREAPAVVVPASASPATPSCATCTHRRGRADLHFGCVAREDLLPLYGAGHPLRALLEDDGASCTSFEFWPGRGGVWH